MTDLSAEERLKELNTEKKAIRGQAMSERKKRLENQAAERINRDLKIEKTRETLTNISEMIYKYNKLGKIAKDNVNIFGDIRALIDSYSPLKETKFKNGSKIIGVDVGYADAERFCACGKELNDDEDVCEDCR